MHGHGSARAEIVSPGVFWGESESGRAHSLALCPEDGDNDGSADRAETLRGRVVADCGGRITAMLSQVEEDVDAHSNWAGGRSLRSEVRDGLTSNGILLVVQGEDDLCDVIKPPGWGIGGDAGVPDEKDELLEGTELHYPAMAGALGVLTGPQAEVESQDDQVGGVSGLLVRG